MHIYPFNIVHILLDRLLKITIQDERKKGKLCSSKDVLIFQNCTRTLPYTTKKYEDFKILSSARNTIVLNLLLLLCE